MHSSYVTPSLFGTVPCSFETHTMGFEAYFYAALPRHGRWNHSGHRRVIWTLGRNWPCDDSNCGKNCRRSEKLTTVQHVIFLHSNCFIRRLGFEPNKLRSPRTTINARTLNGAADPNRAITLFGAMACCCPFPNYQCLPLLESIVCRSAKS